MRIAFILLALAPSLTGCSADVASAPEPELTTPGAFFAAPDTPATLRLYRTLGQLSPDEAEYILLVIVYDATPANVAEATVLAKDPRLEILYELEAFVADPATAQVVWFRTLTERELEVLR